ncbi:unnamed protein product [Commensalibacter communis]|nr:unnamed protein product [Commensalibacter communis]CAI3939142.1 unnamed protein product [Commensalibacter communis]
MLTLLQDSTEPYDLNALAFLYEKGWGGPKDEEQAKTLYKKACSINSYQCEYHYSYFK